VGSISQGTDDIRCSHVVYSEITGSMMA